MEWKYVGESGIELKSRNSHSLAVIESSKMNTVGTLMKVYYLVVYGGASLEDGPMGIDDMVYAELPDPSSIGEWYIVYL